MGFVNARLATEARPEQDCSCQEAGQKQYNAETHVHSTELGPLLSGQASGCIQVLLQPAALPRLSLPD